MCRTVEMGQYLEENGQYQNGQAVKFISMIIFFLNAKLQLKYPKVGALQDVITSHIRNYTKSSINQNIVYCSAFERRRWYRLT